MVFIIKAKKLKPEKDAGIAIYHWKNLQAYFIIDEQVRKGWHSFRFQLSCILKKNRACWYFPQFLCQKDLVPYFFVAFEMHFLQSLHSTGGGVRETVCVRINYSGMRPTANDFPKQEADVSADGLESFNMDMFYIQFHLSISSTKSLFEANWATVN